MERWDLAVHFRINMKRPGRGATKQERPVNCPRNKNLNGTGPKFASRLNVIQFLGHVFEVIIL